MTILHGALGNAIIRAQHLLDAGDRGAAADLLRAHLAGYRYNSAPNDPVLIDAATLYARAEQQHPDLRRGWAGYAAEASRRRYHLTDPRRLAATHISVMVLFEQQRYPEACRSLTMMLAICREHGMNTDSLHIQTGIAQLLHAQGHCGEGIRHAGRAWQQWRDHPTDTEHGATILGAYADMLRDCHREPEVHALATQAAQQHPQLLHHFADPNELTTADRVPATTAADAHDLICARRYNAELIEKAQRAGPKRRPPRT